MKQAKTILLTAFWSSIAFALLMVIAFETELLPAGTMAAEQSVEFILLSVMEVVTVCLIPLALRLFKFRKVRRSLLSGDQAEKARALMGWGLVRMSMLCLPMIINTLFYYMFMSVAFGYMGIIGLLCLVFVYPSAQRCTDETSEE